MKCKQDTTVKRRPIPRQFKPTTTIANADSIYATTPLSEHHSSTSRFNLSLCPLAIFAIFLSATVPAHEPATSSICRSTASSWFGSH